MENDSFEAGRKVRVVARDMSSRTPEPGALLEMAEGICHRFCFCKVLKSEECPVGSEYIMAFANLEEVS